MYMDEGADTGDVLLKKAIAIRPAETGGSPTTASPKSLRQHWTKRSNQLENGPHRACLRIRSAATYAPKLGREDGRIDWNEPAVLIERKIRAFDPWPGAFTVLRDSGGRERKLKVFRARHSGRREGSRPALTFPTQERSRFAGRGPARGKAPNECQDFLRGYPGPIQLA
jgi:methionyl-tRNA formyltransferase